MAKIRAHFQTVKGNVPGQVLHIEKEVKGFIPSKGIEYVDDIVTGTLDDVKFVNDTYIATIMELIQADSHDSNETWEKIQKSGWKSLEPIAVE